MTRVAAVDCGTNSVRLLVADLEPDGSQRDLHREMRVVRLGEGVDATGVLSHAALARTRDALTDFAGTCASLRVEHLRLVATSATRDAGNRDEFGDLVHQVLHVSPDVLTGDQEAALSFEGATRGLPRGDGPFLVVDIGGGSTEVVLGHTSVCAARSVDVGCVRLTERHLHDDPPRPEQVSAAVRDIDVALELVAAQVPVQTARTVIGLAGSVTTVAALALGLEHYDAERIHLARLTAPQIHDVTEQLLRATRSRRAALPVMHPGRVDVIAAGALVLSVLVDRFGVDEIVVSEADILDGIAWSMDTREGR